MADTDTQCWRVIGRDVYKDVRIRSYVSLWTHSLGDAKGVWSLHYLPPRFEVLEAEQATDFDLDMIVVENNDPALRVSLRELFDSSPPNMILWSVDL